MGNYAIITVFILTIVLATYTNSARRNLYSAQLEMVENYNSNQAKNVAKSVALAVISKLNDPNDSDYNTNRGQVIYYPSQNGRQDWASMGSTYWVKLRNQGDTLLFLETKGWSGAEEYNQEIKLLKESPVWNPALPYAVFSGSTINLTGSARLVGHSGTNANGVGKVNLAWSTSIDSSLQIGPGGSPLLTVNQANFIGGNVGLGITNLPSPQNYPLPTYPTNPPKTSVKAAISVNWSTNGMTLSPTDYDGSFIPSVTVPSNWSLTIDTGTEDRVLHVGDLNITQGHINVIGSGKLDIIIENQLQLNGSSTLNSGGDQNKVFTYYGGAGALNFGGSTVFNSSIYAQRADITIGGSGGLQGHVITGGANVIVSGAAVANTRVLYAPNARVQVTGSGSIRGAVIASSFDASGNARVYFSKALTSTLPELEVSTGSSGYNVVSWF
tara:strand:- start:39693 stop:41015 length:1323 start_codon:yes stop_codon:yes gene_type:complete